MSDQVVTGIVSVVGVIVATFLGELIRRRGQANRDNRQYLERLGAQMTNIEQQSFHAAQQSQRVETKLDTVDQRQRDHGERISKLETVVDVIRRDCHEGE